MTRKNIAYPHNRNFISDLPGKVCIEMRLGFGWVMYKIMLCIFTVRYMCKEGDTPKSPESSFSRTAQLGFICTANWGTYI